MLIPTSEFYRPFFAYVEYLIAFLKRSVILPILYEFMKICHTNGQK